MGAVGSRFTNYFFAVFCIFDFLRNDGIHYEETVQLTWFVLEFNFRWAWGKRRTVTPFAILASIKPNMVVSFVNFARSATLARTFKHGVTDF